MMLTKELRDFLLQVRQALLMMVDAIERLTKIAPTTAEIRSSVEGREGECQSATVIASNI